MPDIKPVKIKLTAVVFVLLLFFSKITFAQTDSANLPEFNSSWFANIFTAFWYSPGNRALPSKGFELSTGLLGYRAEWGDKARATIIYDVYRTTGNIMVTDQSGDILNASWFSGSDYTGFLKMAQIDILINSWLELSAGQLLNQQYLTYQDRFWGFRYISTTFQELYRFGSPADFGARITIRPHSSLATSLNIVNGNGPFRIQGDDGKLQYATNVEWSPTESFILKFYADHMASTGKPDRNAISFFAGYKTEEWRLGFEANMVNNHMNDASLDLKGVSTYGAVKFAEGWHFLGRHDYIIKSMSIEKAHYLITGLEYEPYRGLFTSLNWRYLSEGKVSWIYASFGAKF
ncbi:MAG: hypothetical protein R6W67_00860 [Bacteroidales bacterium]